MDERERIQEENPDLERREKRDVWLGMGLLALLHLLTLLHPPLFFFIGVSQTIYLIPAIVLFSFLKRGGIVQGLMIGAGITLLLNVTCAGIVLFAFLG